MGLKLRSPSSFGIAKPDLIAEFYRKFHKSIQSGTCQTKPKRGRVAMMPLGTPRVPFESPGVQTQWIDLWSFLYQERCMFIGNYIDGSYSNVLLATMLYLDSLDSSERLNVYINSPGGDITPTVAVYDTMQSLESPVGTNVLGHAYDLAGFLLAAGQKGYRVAMPLSRISLYTPGGRVRGQSEAIRSEAMEHLRIREYLSKELANQTGKPVEQINEDLKKLAYFSAQEALEYGLIDRIRYPKDKAPGNKAPGKDIVTTVG